jgi:SAM-dependent methyltransferase
MSDHPKHDFEAGYQAGGVPWDIGAPQPEVVTLAEEGEIVGDVLDVGCGTGENALYLASLGRRVLGVDAAPTAIARAREKAAARGFIPGLPPPREAGLGRGLPPAFLVADALDLGRLRRRFETVLDCGLFHTFEPDERRLYAQSLCEVLSSGGTLHLLCFSDEEPPGPGPRRIAQHELGDAFRGIFVITRLRPGRLASTFHPGGARAWVATLTMI